MKRGALRYTGCCGGIFLGGYGLARFIIEYFREPDAHLGFIFAHFSMGQLLSIPMILIGLWLIISSKNRISEPQP
jgi:phosphatidylglycerol:prolipoprotein diacylglycerol transferase